MDDEIVTLTEKRFFEWYEDDKSVTLRNCGGSYGGGSEVLVIVKRSAEACVPMIEKASTTNMYHKES